MTSAVCPNCGTDLMRFEPVQRGELDLLAHEIRWKGEQVPLPPCGKLLISAIVRADGRPISLSALGEAMGCTEKSKDPANLIYAHVSHVRRAFRQVDPSFNAVESVVGFGFRWAA